MMNLTLTELLHQLQNATTMTDVFGPLPALGEDALKQRYRTLAAIAHPDRNLGQRTTADEAFKLLQQWHTLALRQLRGAAAQATPLIDITTRLHHYVGTEAPVHGDLCDLYPANAEGTAVLLKSVRDARNNDLLQTEAQTLRRISRALTGESLRAHFPTLIEHVLMADATGQARQINVLQTATGFVSLAAVLRTYPSGIDTADAAWMFNRMLAALGVTHSLGIVHGALTLDHVLICPADHNGMLIDWCYSVPIGEPIKAVSLAYMNDYPPEVQARQPATAATDLYMAAQCLVRLLGGKPHHTGTNPVLPDRVPKPIRTLLHACLLPARARRAGDAWELFDDFNAALHRCYGAPKFRPFTL